MNKKILASMMPVFLCFTLLGCSVKNGVNATSPDPSDSAISPSATSTNKAMTKEQVRWPNFGPPYGVQADSWKVCGGISEPETEITCNPSKKHKYFAVNVVCRTLEQQSGRRELHIRFKQKDQLMEAQVWPGCPSEVGIDEALQNMVSGAIPQDYDPANGPITVVLVNPDPDLVYRVQAGFFNKTEEDLP